jgi:hypothetical protein
MYRTHILVNMAQAFIIMQIGHADLDRVCADVIVPALKEKGFDPKRVDKHNQGGLLKSEIIGFIQDSEIIVADLTNERPNCYLEVGYAMGLDKFRNLILTARKDHDQNSSVHRPGGPKVHFDLQGYDVLFWEPENLPAFKEELQKRIDRRLVIIGPPAGKPAPTWDETWIEKNRLKAREGLQEIGLAGYTETQFAIADSTLRKNPSELLQAAERALIHTFGWPIGIVLDNEQRPRPVADGIVAEIPTKTFNSYDYWALRRNGDFYLLHSLFEDQHTPGCVFYDTRIVRLTESLLYCARLYTQLGIPPASVVHFGLRHGGLKNRILSSSVPAHWSNDRRSLEDEIYAETEFTLASVESPLVDLVKQLTEPLFELFDFYHVPEERYQKLVNGFVSDTEASERRR